MSTKEIKVGNVILTIPDSSDLHVGQPQDRKKLIAERGEEAKPIASLPPIPNPNDFVGASTFQVHAISRIGTSEKKWVNKAGFLIFGVAPIVLVEAACIWVWVEQGKWTAFAIANVMFAFIFRPKGKAARK
jgi:hypothetical protein